MCGKKSKKGFLSEKRFDMNAFIHPETGYAPVYSWMWNDKLSHEETDRRLEEMLRLGIKRFYILPIPKDFRPSSLPSRLAPDYLTQAYLEEYRYAVQRAAELDMEVWLYDEGGWPSGAACGKVLAESDDYAREFVRRKTRFLESGETYSPDADVIVAFTEEGRQVEAGDHFSSETKIDEYVSVKVPWQGTFEVPDVTKKEAVEAFLRITHDRYESIVKDYFSDTVTAVFTDEPTGPRPFPYRQELADTFFRKYNVRIKDYFPFIFGVLPMTEEAERIVIDWYDFCSRTFCRNFLGVEGEWTRSRGLAFLGHMDKDDEPSGSLRGGNYQILRALRSLDVPGVDAIHRQIYPDKEKVEKAQRTRKNGKFTVEKANRFFPRYASSAAAQIGKRNALTESFAVYGNALTFEEMRYVLNFQAIRGINVFNLMLLSYGKSGFLRAGEQPHFAETHAAFSKLSNFNRYAERLSYLASLGERAADVALYYPIRDSYIPEKYDEISEQYEQIGTELECLHIEYDIFDDDVILAADDALLDEGVVATGKARYKTLVFPYCRHLSKEAECRVERFIKGGGNVLFIRSHSGEKMLPGALSIDLSALGKYISPAIEFKGESRGIKVAHSRLENGELYLLFNEAHTPMTFSLALPSGQAFLIEDLASPVIFSIPETKKNLTRSLPSGEMICILRADDKIKAETLYPLEEEGKIEKWTFRRTQAMVIDEEDIRTQKLSESPRPVALGDWRNVVGMDFSGTGVYESSFNWDVSKDCLIDLGEVKYVAELFVNGIQYPPRLMPPYRYRIPASALKPHNTICISVTNSCANAFQQPKAFEKYEEWQLSSYYEIEKEYLADSLAGGLFGEVKLFSCAAEQE